MPPLPIDDDLPVHTLAGIFRNVTNSYKFYWLLSILHQLEINASPRLTVAELCAEVLALVWSAVNYFHLSFGKQDKLSSAAIRLREEAGLSIDSASDAVRSAYSKLPADSLAARAIADVKMPSWLQTGRRTSAMPTQAMFSISSLFVACALSNSVALAEEDRTYTSGPNVVTVKVFNVRDLGDLDYPVTLLRKRWNTDQEILWDVGATLGLLSKMVYDDDDEALDYTLRGMGFTKWISVKNQTMAAHVLMTQEVTVIVFRGTNPLELDDWRKNIKMGLIRYRPAGDHQFHEGFWTAYTSVRNEILHFIDRNKTESIWVTGHSLGGAMACVCTVDLECGRDRRSTLVTFGQPRVADSGGAQWIDQKLRGRYARFVHGDDIVPSLPPTIPLLFPYAHAGSLVAMYEGRIVRSQSVATFAGSTKAYCGECGRVVASAPINVYQPSIEPPPLTESEFDAYFPPKVVEKTTSTYEGAGGGFTTIRFPRYVRDHLMTSYLEEIRSYRDGQASVPLR